MHGRRRFESGHSDRRFRIGGVRGNPPSLCCRDQRIPGTARGVFGKPHLAPQCLVGTNTFPSHDDMTVWMMPGVSLLFFMCNAKQYLNRHTVMLCPLVAPLMARDRPDG